MPNEHSCIGMSGKECKRENFQKQDKIWQLWKKTTKKLVCKLQKEKSSKDDLDSFDSFTLTSGF